MGVAQHRLAAGRVELLDPHGHDLGLAGDAKEPLGLHLGRQPVAVPAESPLHPPALHRAEPRHHVLDIAGDEVAVVRQAVGERRARRKRRTRCPAGAAPRNRGRCHGPPSRRARLLPAQGSSAGPVLRSPPDRQPWPSRPSGKRSSGGTSSRRWILVVSARTTRPLLRGRTAVPPRLPRARVCRPSRDRSSGRL